jgi:hypothetical protein
MSHQAMSSILVSLVILAVSAPIYTGPKHAYSPTSILLLGAEMFQTLVF